MQGLAAKAHDVFSSGVYLPLSRLQRRVHPARRETMSEYQEGMRFRRASAEWSADLKRQWVLGRLRFLLRRAYAETEYYKTLFDRIGFDPKSEFTFEEFAQLPILEREDVRNAGRDLISRAIQPDKLQRDSTGGSTGEPTEIWVGPEEKGWRESAAESFMQAIGAQAGARTALLWGHHLDPVKSDNIRDRWYSFATNTRWFDCFRLSADVLDAYHREFSKMSPACIVAYAGALADLARRILERGVRADYPSRCLVTGAEKLYSHDRRAIEDAFGKPVHERYGARDVGPVGFQSAPAWALDFQIDWSNVLVEPETSEPNAPILITKLHADGMPMIRYRIGDIGRFPSASRPGNPAFKLHEVVGREVDRIRLRDGRWISGAQMPHLLKDYCVKRFMFVQRSDYSIELKIIPAAGFMSENRDDIFATVSANLPGLPLSLQMVDELPRTRSNKHRPVMSELAMSRGR